MVTPALIAEGGPRHEAPGSANLRRLLGRTLRALLAEAGAADALVAWLQPQRGLDLRHTSGFRPTDETALRAAAERLADTPGDIATDRLSGPGVGAALEVGDGSVVLAIVRAVDTDGRTRFLERAPVVLLGLA